MKAILLKEFGDTDVMYFGETPLPDIADNQVLIRVAATSVNGPDIVQRRGNYAPPKGESEILGLEVAGTIEQLGSQVTDWKIGDRVMSLIGGGGYGQFASAHPGHMMSIPDWMSFNQAACICETYITAYLNVFVLGELKKSETVLLHGGGGGVNTAGIQLCKQLVPDCKVIVTASTAKLEKVTEVGADHVVDYKNESFPDVVKKLTDGRGADVILDHIGGPYLPLNMKCLAVAGRLLEIGVTGGIKAELNIALMMVKRQKIIGSVLRSRSVNEKASIVESFNNLVMPLFQNQKIVPLIYEVFSLEDAAKAHEVMEQSQHFGKIVLEVSH